MLFAFATSLDLPRESEDTCRRRRSLIVESRDRKIKGFIDACPHPARCTHTIEIAARQNEALPIVVDDDAADRAFTDIVHLARTYPLSAHDAAYLERAIRRGLPSARNDGKLETAAAAAGDVRFSPP